MNQEQIVDNIILDMLEVKKPGSKQKILDRTTKSSRRLAMLSILDDDRQLFNDYKKIVLNEPPQECGEYSTDIVKLLKKYVVVADMEVKVYGEVMTPLPLVDEMLNMLPKEVWSNPNLKWLDPCNGAGTYPSVVVKRLMIGLKDVIVGDCNRYRHIIENMIYVCEIQPKNMFLFHCAFDRQDDHELNTYFGSFLTKEFDEHKKNVWGVEKFDIVMGNPPFQKTESDDKRTYPLWDEFVDKSISLLNINGFLNFIHPGAWRNAKGHFKKTQKLLRTKTFLILKMFNSKKGKEIFNKLVSCDYYCLQNKINDNEKTIITFEDGITLNIDISKLEAIPSAKYQEINSIISKENQDKVEVLYSRSNYGHDSRNISNVETDTHIYPVIYTIKKNGEKRLIWSNTNKNGHFGIPKVIWSNGASFPIIDFTGEYGVSDYSYSIVDKPENLERICKAMKSKKFLSYMEVAEGPGQSGIYKHRIISLFIKDFYKQFIDENGNEI